MKKILIASLGALLLTPVASNASVIWDNGASNPSNTGANFSQVGNTVEADDFTVTSNETLRSVQFWGSHWSSGAEPAVESFNAYIYADNAGNVGNLIGSSALSLVSKIDTGFDHNNLLGANILEFTMDVVNPILLNAGSFWFSVVSADNPGTRFAWQETGLDGSGNFKLSSNQGASWTNRSNELAFNLSNNFAGTTSVPEPASLALFGLGLAGLGLSRRKKVI